VIPTLKSFLDFDYPIDESNPVIGSHEQISMMNENQAENMNAFLLQIKVRSFMMQQYRC
jgi:hypothetical protein